MMADGRRQVLQGDLYMQIDRSIVLEKYIGNSLRMQTADDGQGIRSRIHVLKYLRILRILRILV